MFSDLFQLLIISVKNETQIKVLISGGTLTLISFGKVKLKCHLLGIGQFVTIKRLLFLDLRDQRPDPTRYS